MLFMLTIAPSGVRLPTGNRSIFSYFIDMESGNFVPWEVLVPSTKFLIEKGAVITIGETMGVASHHRKGQTKEAEIVPTVDIARFSFLTGLLLLNKHPVLLTGMLSSLVITVQNQTFIKILKILHIE